MSELVAFVPVKDPIASFQKRLEGFTKESPKETLDAFYLDLFNHLSKDGSDSSPIKIGRVYELRPDGLYHNRLNQGFLKTSFEKAQMRLLKEFNISTRGKQYDKIVLLSDENKFFFDKQETSIGVPGVPWHYLNDLRTKDISEWSASDYVKLYLLFKGSDIDNASLPFYLSQGGSIVFTEEFLGTVPEIGKEPCSIWFNITEEESRVNVYAYSGKEPWNFETEERFDLLKSVLFHALGAFFAFVSRGSIRGTVRPQVLGRTIPLKEDPALISPTLVLDRIKSMVDTVEFMGLIDDRSKHVFYATQTFILIKLLSNYSTYRKSPDCSFMINEIDDTIEMIYMVDGDLGKITYDQKIHSLSGIGTGDSVEKFNTVLKICNHFKNMFLKDVL